MDLEKNFAHKARARKKQVNSLQQPEVGKENVKNAQKIITKTTKEVFTAGMSYSYEIVQRKMQVVSNDLCIDNINVETTTKTYNIPNFSWERIAEDGRSRQIALDTSFFTNLSSNNLHNNNFVKKTKKCWKKKKKRRTAL